MIFLEKTVYQILREEGQLVVTLDDLEITMDQLNDLFIGTFDQCKGYITVYDWGEEFVGIDGVQEPEWTHLRHITYNTYNNMQRFMPDVPGNYWEFNPYTKKMSSLMATNFSTDYGKYPYCGPIQYDKSLGKVKTGLPLNFTLPCSFDIHTFKMQSGVDDTKYIEVVGEADNVISLAGPLGQGEFNSKTLKGTITTTEDVNDLNTSFISKYAGILELDETCELFFVWFKANMLCMIGSVKEQTDLQGVQLPFDYNKDGILQRGRELLQRVEELKVQKQHWSNF